jgi:hypothetical protein
MTVALPLSYCQARDEQNTHALLPSPTFQANRTVQRARANVFILPKEVQLAIGRMVDSDGVAVSALAEFVSDTIAAPHEKTKATVSLGLPPSLPPTARGSRFSSETPEIDRRPQPGEPPGSLPTAWTEPARGLMRESAVCKRPDPGISKTSVGARDFLEILIDGLRWRVQQSVPL